MGRLKNLAPAIGTLEPRLSTATYRDERERSAVRRARDPWRKWYSTARWRQLRMEVLTEAMFSCAHCKRLEGKTALLVADHIRPHRGDPALFWDRANLQCLCKQCHDRHKQSLERGGVGRHVTGVDGWRV